MPAPRSRNPLSISVVIPCFNEEAVLPELFVRLGAVLSGFSFQREIILIDDGSSDRTWELLVEHQKRDATLKIIRLARNSGHQYALTCGLDQAAGEVILIMDADLQDPPELLGEMLEKWRQGYDVIYGQRVNRGGETRAKRFFAYSFYRLLSKITKIMIVPDTGDFRLMDRRVLTALNRMRERHRFIRGMVSWVGFSQTPIAYDRPARFAGETKYPFKKSVFLAIDAITSFSHAPLRIASYLGTSLSIFSFIYIFIVIWLKIIGVNLPGYTSLMGSVLLLGGVQLLVLGIIGEYVGRIFEQGQQRPLYLIDQIHGEPLLETGTTENNERNGLATVNE